MTHEDWSASAAAYALGALDADERRGFEEHLSACERCRGEVAELRETAALLAYGASASGAPSPQLRERIVREARDVRPISTARSRKRAAFAPWLAAAAALLLAAVAGNAWRQERGARARVLTELTAARQDLALRDSTIAAFLGPEVHVVSLSPTGEKPSMRVFWNHTRSIFIVTAFNLPPAPAGKTYQLWAIRKDKPPLSMGTFNTDASGRATTILAVGSDINAGGFIDLCGLTIEPAGGSSAPTEPPRLLGEWRHTD